jgi:hypothetical protein
MGREHPLGQMVATMGRYLVKSFKEPVNNNQAAMQQCYDTKFRGSREFLA